MPTISWQKSTYSGDSINCVNLATTPSGHVLLRESDDPAVILTTTPVLLNSLIRALKSQQPTH
ncbi:DUF397 domain-containing protein [Streptomyces adelaidensis]|uniref:DUF397 domain-containing protein n=1 Tax=Streptomyces adelaidensis TaxID=2796465 RepID=UPI001907CD70|nr:DUF397 domain-containing protein [Streptomyces adelaidensis]